MPNTKEQRIDLIANCKQLLTQIKNNGGVISNNTPEGRTIAIIQYIIDHAEGYDFILPQPRGRFGMLVRIYAEGRLTQFSSNYKDESILNEEINTPIGNILSLLRGKLLAKPRYTPFIIRYLDKLITILTPLDDSLPRETKADILALPEFKKILETQNVVLPIGNYLNIGHKPFTNISLHLAEYGYPDAERLMTKIERYLLSGRRPDTWLSIEEADREANRIESNDFPDIY